MQRRAVVIGGGIGGLTAACELALRGHAVDLFEAQQVLGGKIAERSVDGQAVNIGPSVLTLRHVFDDLFARAGGCLDDELPIRRLDEIGRHYFFADGRLLPPLDLYPDRGANADAIGDAFGRQARDGYLNYAAYCERMWASASEVFVFGQKPSLVKAVWTFGRRAFRAAQEMDAMRTMHDALIEFFPRCRPLRQLFGRYATYAGSSPFAAPATLHLVAHVEQLGSWAVQGGLYALGQAVARLAMRLGVKVHLGRPVMRVIERRGRARGVGLQGGDEVDADLVIFSGDVAARKRPSLWGTPSDDDRRRVPLCSGLSGMVTAFVGPRLEQPLSTHTICFGDEDEEAEYRAVLDDKRIAARPNVYICAQDRAWLPSPAPKHDASAQPANERLFTLVNAPPARQALGKQEKKRWEAHLREHLARFGLCLGEAHQAMVHEPAEFAGRFYGSDGVLYGRPAHAWRTFFDRPSSRSKLKGLYLAGGTVHPGPGVPMAAVSGTLAARAASEDFPST